MVSPDDEVEDLFPGLRGKDWRITSPADTRYNCIAWAAGNFTQWWPADPRLGYYRPEGVERVETPAAFVVAFALLGYEPCDTPDHGPGYERVAIFAEATGTPTHAARQLPGGRWTSKLGNLVDIEHDLDDIRGEIYGSVVKIMRRSGPSV